MESGRAMERIFRRKGSSPWAVEKWSASPFLHLRAGCGVAATTAWRVGRSGVRVVVDGDAG